MGNLVNFHPNERVDLDDLEAISLFALDDDRRFNANVMSSVDDVIVSGFDFTIVSTTDLRINRGVAMTPGDATGVRGQLLTEGDATQTLSFSGLTTSVVYTIWIRFAYGDGELGNRVFWDPVAPEEVVQTVATRQIAAWFATIAVTSPGADWIPVWTVDWNGDLLTGAGATESPITDIRKRLFAVDGDGDFLNGTYQADVVNNYRSTWGAGNDRNNNRSTYGIDDLRTFVQMTYKKLEEIQTGTNPNISDKNWWHAPAASLDDVVPLSGAVGNYAMRGSIDFNANEAYDVGSNSNYAATMYSAIINLKERMAVGVGGSIAPGIDINTGANLLVAGGAELNVQSGGKLELKSGAIMDVEDGSYITYQSSADMLWYGTGDLAFTAGGIAMSAATTFVYTSSVSAKVDSMEPDTAAGSFLGQNGNRYASIYGSTAIFNNLTASANATLTAAAINWAGATAAGDLSAAAAGSGSLGTAGAEFDQVRAYEGVFGDPSAADNVNIAPIKAYTFMTSTGASVFEIDVASATNGGVFDFSPSGFTANASGVTNEPWTGGTGQTSGCVGKIRINSLPGINGGNPVWLRVYSGIL